MNMMGELTLIFGVCLVGELVSALLSVAFPASVISMVLLLALLLCGAVKERQIDRTSRFLVSNMSFFFLPPCVGILEYAQVLRSQLLPFLLICVLTTPLVYCVTAWTVQLLLMHGRRGAGRHA